MSKLFLLILLIIYLPLMAQSDQVAGEDTVTRSITGVDSDSLYTLPIEPYFTEKEMSKDSILKWQNQDQYRKTMQLDSLLRSIQATNLKNVQRGTEGVSLFTRILNSSLLKTILWIIAAAFVLFILYKLIVSKGFFLSSRKQKEPISTVEDAERKEWTNLDALLMNAVQEKKYRLATRYLFLNVLKTLGERGLVNIEPEKTNAAYRNELPMESRQGFTIISNLFERIWYGNAVPDEEQFKIVESRFAKFKAEMNL